MRSSAPKKDAANPDAAADVREVDSAGTQRREDAQVQLSPHKVARVTWSTAKEAAAPPLSTEETTDP